MGANEKVAATFHPEQAWRAGNWMQTFTGRKFHPMDPHPDDVAIEDIAHALSLLCRYNGHVDRFYSVAEHCVLMSSTFGQRDLALWALLHDATEAYVGDMIRPLKLHMPEYRLVEDRVMLAIAVKFGLTGAMPAAVKDADTRILLTERNTLMSATAHPWDVDAMQPLPVTVRGWQPAEAERLYLEAFDALYTAPEPARVAEPKRTPDEWQHRLGVSVMDPDGWDRSNFEEDWSRPLTQAEFEAKAYASTTAYTNERFWHTPFTPTDYLGDVTP